MRSIRFLAGAASLALLAGCGMIGDRGPIYLALVGPIQTPYGESMERAASMAIEEINRGGGVRGRTLELLIRDDLANAERAIEIAAELRDDPRVVAVVGHFNSTATLAAAQIYNDERRGLLQISPSASSPLLSGAGPWSFRVCPSDLLQGPALADWLLRGLGEERAAVIYANDEYGRGLVESFGTAYARIGGEVVSRDPFLPDLIDSETALDPYIERMIRRDVGAVVIGGLMDEALVILRAARRLGFAGRVLGADGLIGAEAAGNLAEGIYISTPFLPDRPTPEAQSFVQAFDERFGRTPDAFAAMTYDTVRLLARAIGEAGTGRRALRDYISAVGRTEPPFEGVSGTVAFDENGDVPGKEITIGIVRAGRLVTASNR